MNDVDQLGGGEYISQSIGNRLRIARENADISKEQLARRIGVSVRVVESWEDGGSVPRGNRLQILAGILNISLRWLLEGGEGDEADSRSDAPDSIEAMHSELQRLYATLGQAKANVKQSLDRLAEIAESTRDGDEKLGDFPE